MPKRLAYDSRILAAAVAGPVAGLAFGALMTVVPVPRWDGHVVPMIALVAETIRADSIVAGWLVHLFYSLVIGALFGLLYVEKSRRTAVAIGWGSLYGLVWWVLGGLILMPSALGLAIFTPITMETLRPYAFWSFVGHMLYGVALGGMFALVRGEQPRQVPGEHVGLVAPDAA